MDIRIGSGVAGVHEGGNVIEDVRFFGGQYGVWSRRPSPGWQYTLVDTYFEGQRVAAIREQEAGLTLIRPHFKAVPTAVEIDQDKPDELWVKDARLEDVSGPAFLISHETSVRTEINMEGVVCRNVPTFAAYRDSGKKAAGPAVQYVVKSFSYGLHFADLRAQGVMKQTFDAAPLAALPAPVASDLPALPPAETWANVRELGAKGDGKTDDTEALRKAIAAHRTLYLPTGIYVITDTLQMKPDTVIIGLHPSTTQLVLVDGTPAFQGVGAPKPMLEAPRGGSNIVLGFGLYTNGANPRALALKWMAGANSMVNDVRFHGGHGTSKIDGTRDNPYNNNHTADPDLRRRWDGQYPSLWVTNNGGGTFLDLWTPSSFAQAGFLVSDTTTEGRVYQVSSEHHVRHEMQLRNAHHWRIYALQTEAERGESGFDLPLEIDASSDITIANFHIYRVISNFQPFPWAVKVTNSRDIRFRNFHCYSNSKVSYDAAIFDSTHNAELRQREFAHLNLTGAAPAPQPARRKAERLAGGFFNASGGAVAPNGDFYFVDAKWQRIYRWDARAKTLSIVHDAPLDPINLAFDKAGNLLVASYTGNGVVYTFNAAKPGSEIALIAPTAAAPRPGLTPVLPVGDFALAHPPQARPHHYLSPDGTTFLAADQAFVSGSMNWGVKGSPMLRSFGLAPANPAKPFYFTDEMELRTWSATIGADGSVSNMKLFAEQGGEGVTVGPDGKVYIAAGHVYVYSPEGKLLDTIEVAERPTQVLFGGPNGRTLFLPARTSLYAITIP